MMHQGSECKGVDFFNRVGGTFACDHEMVGASRRGLVSSCTPNSISVFSHFQCMLCRSKSSQIQHDFLCIRSVNAKSGMAIAGIIMSSQSPIELRIHSPSIK